MTLETTNAEIEAAERLIEAALDEDAASSDATTRALIDPNQQAIVSAVARESGILAGGWILTRVFSRLNRRTTVDVLVADGAPVERGRVVATIQGPLPALLTGERTALNFLLHLSGIATLTRRYVDAIAGTKAAIFDTRKTLPGWRRLEKYAVRAGGGRNHRMDLREQILIKDNHLAGWHSADPGRTIAQAIAAARRAFPNVPIEVEVDDLDQLRDALAERPEMALLDNMNCEQLRAGVALRDRMAPMVELEASGRVNLETVRAIADTGVERISIGKLTHSAPALDLAFDWQGARDAGRTRRPNRA